MSRELEALARRVPLARRAGDDHLFGLMGEGLEELELVSRSEAEQSRAARGVRSRAGCLQSMGDAGECPSRIASVPGMALGRAVC